MGERIVQFVFSTILLVYTFCVSEFLPFIELYILLATRIISSNSLRVKKMHLQQRGEGRPWLSNLMKKKQHGCEAICERVN